MRQSKRKRIVFIVTVNSYKVVLGNVGLFKSGEMIQKEYNNYQIIEVDTIISALQKTNNGNNTDFINFISEMVLESQKEYLKIISRF